MPKKKMPTNRSEPDKLTTTKPSRSGSPNPGSTHYHTKYLYSAAAAEPLLVDPLASSPNPNKKKNLKNNTILFADSETNMPTCKVHTDGTTTLSTSPKSAQNENDEAEDEKHDGLISSLKRYPKGVFFMLGNEFCERFSFYGMRAILTLYLIEEHHLSNR